MLVRSLIVMDAFLSTWHVRMKMSMDTISALLSAYPEAVRVVNNHGRLPLHVACYYVKSDEAVLALLSAYPCALRVGDAIGHRPLHRVCYDIGRWFPSNLTHRTLAFAKLCPEVIFSKTSHSKQTCLDVLKSNLYISPADSNTINLPVLFRSLLNVSPNLSKKEEECRAMYWAYNWEAKQHAMCSILRLWKTRKE
jgi:hypothetical protein